MKKLMIPIIVIAICAAGVSVYAYEQRNAQTLPVTTRTETQTSESTTDITTLAQTTVSETQTTPMETTVKETTVTETTTSRHNEDDIIAAVKSEYGIDNRYVLVKKSYDGGTEYYWEWVDENGYANMYDALRVIVKDGNITFKKRFDDKASEGKIIISKEEAVKIAGGGKVKATLYMKGGESTSPRLSYKVVNSYNITYVDTENGNIVSKDMIK